MQLCLCSRGCLHAHQRSALCSQDVHIMLFHSRLAFSLQERLGWVNLVIRSNQIWACMFAFVFRVPALPWAHLSFEAAHCLDCELCLCACVCECVCVCVWHREREKKERERDASREDKDNFDHTEVSLMSCSYLSEHLRYHHRCGWEWEASSRGKLLFVVCFKGD